MGKHLLKAVFPAARLTFKGNNLRGDEMPYSMALRSKMLYESKSSEKKHGIKHEKKETKLQEKQEHIKPKRK